MKTLKTLVILCIMFGLGLESVKAQVPQMSYQKIDGITSISIGNLNTVHDWINPSGLYSPIGLTPVWIDITEKPGFAFITTSRNYLDIINEQALFDSTLSKLRGKLSIPGFGIADSFNCKLALLTMKPTFATSGYNYQSKKKTKPYISNKPDLFNNKWYRFAGYLYNANMDVKYPLRPDQNTNMNTKYPSRTAPKK
jgi:hypothetical protein